MYGHLLDKPNALILLLYVSQFRLMRKSVLTGA